MTMLSTFSAHTVLQNVALFVRSTAEEREAVRGSMTKTFASYPQSKDIEHGADGSRTSSSAISNEHPSMAQAQAI